MKACLQTFKIGISELQVFLNCTEQETELIGIIGSYGSLGTKEKQLLTSISQAHINRKRYIYTVAIVSLYGLLERLVDTIIEAYVCRLAGLVNVYGQMPEAIKKNHIPLSIELLKAITDERHWISEKPENVIRNLNSCLSNSIPFQLNGAAFALHRGNVTLTKIGDFFSAIGVDNHLRRATKTRALIEFFQKIEPERDVRNISDQDLQTLLNPINELVEQRNQISHGVINIDDIESTELLKERCSFVEAYGSSLYSILEQEILKVRVKQADVQSFGKPISVFNKSIVCFETERCSISVGNSVAAATNDLMEPFRYGCITKIEIDHQVFNNIDIDKPTKFAAEVSFKASELYDYYIFAADL